MAWIRNLAWGFKLPDIFNRPFVQARSSLEAKCPKERSNSVFNTGRGTQTRKMCLIVSQAPEPVCSATCRSEENDNSDQMASSVGLGSLSIFNEDLLRLILRDEALGKSLPYLASSSTQLLRQVLRTGTAGSGMKLTLGLGEVKLAAKWGEWLQQASGLHLQLDADTAECEAAAILALLLPRPNRGISALTFNLCNVSDAHGASKDGAALQQLQSPGLLASTGNCTLAVSQSCTVLYRIFVLPAMVTVTPPRSPFLLGHACLVPLINGDMLYLEMKI